MKTKVKRLIAIRKIISENALSCQSDVLKLLLNEGYQLTQATLSRDIKELKIYKSPARNGDYIYKLPDSKNKSAIHLDELTSDISVQGFLSIGFSGNLAVIKTLPGFAMAIASHIDRWVTTEILGTIAGDDTILLILHENFTQQEVVHALSKVIKDIRV